MMRSHNIKCKTSLISLILFAVYFTFMQIDFNSIKREVASLDLLNIEVENSKECSYVFDSLDKCLKIKGSIYAYGKTDGHSEFDFPVPKLVTPYFSDVPYEISISNNENVKCYTGPGVKRVGTSYRIEKVVVGSYLKCRYIGEGKGYFHFQYEIPIFQSFPVKEAEWMKGFFPDVVSNTELTLSSIYQKWTEAQNNLKNPSVEDAITYRGRELLLKYEGDSEHKIFDPRKNEFQYEFQLSPGDIVEVSNINGKIIHPKFGQSDYLGFVTGDYSKYSNAGKKYLATKSVKPYGFFCMQDGVIYNFEYSYSFVFDKPGILKCSINTRNHNIFWLQKPKGQVEATFKVMELSKIINRIPKRLVNPKIRISNKINLMNYENNMNFTKWISRSLKAHESSIQALSEVDKIFSFQKVVNATIKKSVLTQVPEVRIEAVENKELRFLNLRLFQRKNYETEEGANFITSELPFGLVVTNTKTSNRNINRYNKQYVFKDNSILNLSSKYFLNLVSPNDLTKDSYSKYLKEMKKAQSKKSSFKSSLDLKPILLNRYMTQVCGKIEMYINGYRDRKQKVTMQSLKAIYDTPRGGAVGELRETMAHLFYSEQVPLKQEIVIYSNVTYKKDTEQCYYLSAPNFVSKNYRDAIFAESF